MDRPKISNQSLYLPFRTDQPIEYESIQWQNEPASTSRFIVQPPSPNRVLQPRNEANIEQPTTTIVLDDNDDQNYVDTIGDDENEIPKIIKKKGKKKKQVAKSIENNDDVSIQLNNSSNRTSTTGQKLPVSILSSFFKKYFLYILFSFSSKNCQQNGHLENVFQVLVLVKQVQFVK